MLSGPEDSTTHHWLYSFKQTHSVVLLYYFFFSPKKNGATQACNCFCHLNYIVMGEDVK